MSQRNDGAARERDATVTSLQSSLGVRNQIATKRADGGGASRDPRIPVVVLAAGASRRFGDDDKLLAPVGDERAVIDLTLDAVLLVVDAHDVIVVMPPDAPKRSAHTRARGIRTVIAPDAARGMRWSIHAGLDAAIDDTEGADAPGVVLVLADDPIAAAALGDVLRVAARLGGSRAVAIDRQPPVPHPVYLPAGLLARMAAPHVDDDSGLRALLESEQVHWLPDDGRAPIDVDVPVDLERLQHRLDDRA